MPFFFVTQLKFFFSCNVVTIITMITCNIIIGTVAITHFQFESTVGMDYQNQNNQDHYKAEEDFKTRNVAGKTGLTVYGIVMFVITSDVFLNASLLMISRDLLQVRQVDLLFHRHANPSITIRKRANERQWLITVSHSLTSVVDWPHRSHKNTGNCFNVTARCSYELCCQSVFDSLAAWCSLNQILTFHPCPP